jgi:hypothetical protein
MGQHRERNHRSFWQQPQNGEGHGLTAILECHQPMQIPLLHPIIPRAHYYDDEGGWEMPKIYTELCMKSNWSETEMFRIK